MGKLIKMELRRLFISKVFYVSMAVVAGVNILLGVIVPILTRVFAPNQKVPDTDLSDIIMSPFSIPIMLVAVMISLVSFAYADIANGYIKNIAGQVSHKNDILFSKFIVVGVHNYIFLLAAVISNIIGIAAGSVLGGSAIKVDGIFYIGAAFATLSIKWMLLMAMSSILMFVIMGIRNKNVASIVGVFLGTGALALVYLGLNTGLSNIFKTNSININNFVPDQLFGTVNVASGAYVINAVIVAIVCVVLFMALTSKVFNSRDIK